MRLGTDDPDRPPTRSAGLDTHRLFTRILAPGAGLPAGEIIAPAYRNVDHTEYWPVIIDQGDIHGKFAITINKLPRPVQWVDQPVARPPGSDFKADFRGLLRQYRPPWGQLFQSGQNGLVGSQVGGCQWRGVFLGLNIEIGLIDGQNSLASLAGDIDDLW